MPSSLGVGTQVAENQFIPPADIGGGGGGAPYFSNPSPVQSMPSSMMAPPAASPGSVSSTDLPALSSSNSNGAVQAMPLQQPSVAPLAAAPANLGPLPVNSSVPLKTATSAPAPSQSPNLTVVPQNAYVHVVESGESLYTIARRYDVTAQAIVTANGSLSPDKIHVGQKLVIPGRPDLLANRAPAARPPVANDASVMPASAPQRPHGTAQGPAPLQAPPAKQQSMPAPVTAALPQTPSIKQAAQTLQTAAVEPKKPAAVLQEPAMSGADKFRWPVSGKVITDFAGTKGTGINIDAPEGSAVRAAENGTVIYVGSGVEGYGNLILIRHANGYVSAYAHLKSMSVAKGDVVNRGDSIGAAGMTGSVSRPQLHFELRKGATPVDPMPLLAG
jgi:murein DD-endopeptidase MepM/ murein hydrolase activator NlpD